MNPQNNVQEIKSLGSASSETPERNPLITDDIFLPAQFFPLSTHAGAKAEEAALRAAVLHSALEDLQGRYVSRNKQTQRFAREAEAWFVSDDIDWPYSFLNVCEALGLNPQAVRGKLPILCRTAEQQGQRVSRSRTALRRSRLAA